LNNQNITKVKPVTNTYTLAIAKKAPMPPGVSNRANAKTQMMSRGEILRSNPVGAAAGGGAGKIAVLDAGLG
jgi:hypothetical protein